MKRKEHTYEVIPDWTTMGYIDEDEDEDEAFPTSIDFSKWVKREKLSFKDTVVLLSGHDPDTFMRDAFNPMAIQWAGIEDITPFENGTEVTPKMKEIAKEIRAFGFSEKESIDFKELLNKALSNKIDILLFEPLLKIFKEHYLSYSLKERKEKLQPYPALFKFIRQHEVNYRAAIAKDLYDFELVALLCEFDYEHEKERKAKWGYLEKWQYDNFSFELPKKHMQNFQDKYKIIYKWRNNFSGGYKPIYLWLEQCLEKRFPLWGEIPDGLIEEVKASFEIELKSRLVSGSRLRGVSIKEYPLLAEKLGCSQEEVIKQGSADNGSDEDLQKINDPDDPNHSKKLAASVWVFRKLFIDGGAISNNTKVIKEDIKKMVKAAYPSLLDTDLELVAKVVLPDVLSSKGGRPRKNDSV
jgi:hypothetical protein